MKRLTAHCPLCGNTSLALETKAGKTYAYCDTDGQRMETSHTRFVVAVKEELPAKKESE